MNLQTENTRFFSSCWLYALGVAIVSMAFLSILVRSILIHPPEYDELLHVLAARGINETGLPQIAQGIYDRAEIFTRLIAWSVQYGKDELLTARLPALFFGMLLVALIGAWVTIRAGWLAGLVAALVLSIAPMTLNASVLVRFYTAHTLVVAVLLIFWFEAASVRSKPANLIGIVLASAALIWLGVQLHVLTLIAACAGIAGVTTLLVYDHKAAVKRVFLSRPRLYTIAILMLLLASSWLFYKFEIMALITGDVPLWSAGKAGNYAYYISSFSVDLPFIWPLFPVMVLFAFVDRPRLTIFCLTAFLCALAMNSILAQKATRYFFHALPMFCVLWGVGFQKLVTFSSAAYLRRYGWNKNVCVVLVLFISAICFINAHEVKRGIKLVLNRGELDDSIEVRNEPNWALANPELEALAKSVDTLVVTSGVKGLFTFGRYDYEFNTTVVQESDTGLDFGTDLRTGRQVIGKPESVSAVIDLPGQELFVLENRMVNQTFSAPEKSVNVLETQCNEIQLSDKSQLSAWLCQ